MESRISSKGQITLPVLIRKKLGVKAGDLVKFETTEEGALIFAKNEEKKINPRKAIQVLHETSGVWKDDRENGKDYVHQLRKKDDMRWKVLKID